jgi:hypothetical protein
MGRLKYSLLIVFIAFCIHPLHAEKILECASLSADKTELVSLTEDFDITASYLENSSSIIFTGNLGIAWCNEENAILKYEVAGDIGLLLPGAYHSALKLTGLTPPSDLSPGTYKLYLAYSFSSEPNTAVRIDGKEGQTPYLLVTVSNSYQASISKPTEGTPHLLLTELSAAGKLYQNRLGQFTATITNDGTGEYNSNLIFKLGSQIVANDFVVIPAGETKTIVFSGTITVEPGNYTLIASDNAGETGSSAEPVTVQAAPPSTIAPNFTVQNITFPDSNQVNKSNPQLTVRIKNEGEPYDDDFIAFVYPASGGSSLTYFGYQTLLIDQNEEKTLVANSSINLPAGQYLVGLYCNNINSHKGNKWMPLGGLIPIVLVESATVTWIAETSTDWNEPTNWTPPVVPGIASNVVISKSDSSPIVPAEGATVNTITFKPGAEIGRQDLLHYEKALVQYDFSSDHSRNRWNMLSVPLQEAYPGDFTFGGYPEVWVRQFKTTTVGSTTNAGWETTYASTTPFSAGSGFIIWLDENKGSDEKGLPLSKGILTLPFFANDSVPADVHHNYDPETATFYNYQEVSQGVYERDMSPGQNYQVERTGAAYKLSESIVTEPLNFGHDSEYASDFTLVGNPFMASLDFTKLQTAIENTGKIKDNYQIWTGLGYVGYNTTTGTFGIEISNTFNEFIAPMQSFIVEKATDYESGGLVFNIPMTDNITNKATLRSSVGNENKLDIVAGNEVAAVRTVIANREGGQNEFADRDARKLVNGISDVPEIYTLKPNGGNRVAVGANIIHNDNLLIPVGLATIYSGKITLTFTGMDTYQAKISLLDVEAKVEKDLTGLASYEYSFDYAGQPVPNEDRFFIRFSPTNLTNSSEPASAPEVAVYDKDRIIHVVSGASNLIRQVSVYNSQGALLQNNTVNSAYFTTKQELVSGVYIVKVVSEKGIQNVKLVIQ